MRDKIRLLLRDQEQLKQAPLQASQKPKYLDDIEKKNYDELIAAILELELAEDPLKLANLELQESFIDEYEQAMKHLSD